MATPKNKKTDYEALNSALMKIPRMKTEVARDLIDIGITETYQLRGRSPEVLLEELQKKRLNVPSDRLAYFKMVIYFAETDTPEPVLLHPCAWT